MEDKKVEEYAEMADTKPRKAIYFGMGLVISALIVVVLYLNNKNNNSQSHEEAALKEQAKAHYAEVANIRKECREDLVAKDSKLAEKDAKIDYWQNQVVTRTDLFASTMTAHVQKQIDKLDKNSEKRLRLDNERLKYRNKDAINLKQLESGTNNNQTNEN